MYDVIMADPPWQYRHSRSRSRSIEVKYSTMTPTQIRALPVAQLASESGALLYLWATMPKLKLALDVMEAWGFEYVTGEAWDKLKYGMGYYTRGPQELLLFGKINGVRPPAPENRPPADLRGGYRGHSRKPLRAYEHAEMMYPDARRVELFARDYRPGWDRWGDEVETTIEGGSEWHGLDL